ncbi:nucleotidyltransferase domain-containing protein [Actinoplanes sp. NPDC049596]|uniref:nucleotidyltransferase domain-containing protein n=1 Tax=unclassified Actinoplanes TaxID=2626549 RepID=UPI0034279A1B
MIAQDVAHRYLKLADDRRPGLVTGLYLVGSAALGAWQPEHSDVDAVILTSRETAPEDLAALAGIHSELGRPFFDGVYLSPALAGIWPDDRRPVPFAVDGVLVTDRPCGELTPVVWLVLRKYGIAIRGAADPGVRVDHENLRRYLLDNLRDYWQDMAAQITAAVPAITGEAVDADSVVWVVLGPARLHYTLVYGDVIAKAAAGGYLAKRFPEYADLAARAVRHRAGHPQQFTPADLAAAAEAADAVAGDAHRRFG